VARGNLLTKGWGERENKDGSGDDTRIQVSFKYDFDGTIFGGAP
jgi:hypothetical protein